MGVAKRIGVRDVAALAVGAVIWDSAVAGFGARRQRGPSVTYLLKYRTENGRQRFYTIGRHGAPWTPDTARDRARELLGEVVKGGDPASDKQSLRKASTVAELCDLYLADAEAGRLLTRRRASKKASTVATDRGRIVRHIKPLLGTLKVAAVTRADIERFLHRVAEGATATRVRTGARGLARVTGGRGTATRTVGLLGAIFSYAAAKSLRADNPVHGVTRFADGRRARRLTAEEWTALGNALRDVDREIVSEPAIAAIRLLALTGWRRGEVIGLRWSDLDLDRRTARLSDTKTGTSVRPLARVVVDILNDQPRCGPFVFPATRGEGPLVGFPKMWNRLRVLAKLPADITPHVLRHSFASTAGDLGYAEATIGACIGHRGHSVTSRYVHAADTVLLAAIDRVAAALLVAMGEDTSETRILAFTARG